MPSLHPVQFQYHPPEMGADYHRVTAQIGEKNVGHMVWSSNQVRNVAVNEEYQRQGIGRGMWNEGHRLAEENARVPKPKHSADRTEAGDAWARSVGGRLPRKTTFKATLGEARPA